MPEIKEIRRWAVIGTSGAGKTTTGKRLGAALGLQYVEMDNLSWEANWVERDKAEFRSEMQVISAGPEWVIDGNYGALKDIIWKRAEGIVWLDMPLDVCVWRVFTRTLRRWWNKEELWDSKNRESIKMSFFQRNSLLKWVIDTWKPRREKTLIHMNSGDFGQARWFRLRTPYEVKSFFAELES